MPNLLLRIFVSIMMLVCIYTSVKYLPLVYVSLTSNLSPLVTAIFSYFIIKVPVSRLDVTILIVSFAGVALLITGTVNDPQFIGESQIPKNDIVV